MKSPLGPCKAMAADIHSLVCLYFYYQYQHCYKVFCYFTDAYISKKNSTASYFLSASEQIELTSAWANVYSGDVMKIVLKMTPTMLSQVD